MTVKAEDRPSGLAGDSASVITFLFRLQPGLVEWRVLVAAARSGAALVSRQAHATVANCIFKVNFGVWEIGSEWLSFALLRIDRRALFRSWDGLS